MSLKFLPIDNNKINTVDAIAFNAYYDKNIVGDVKWRSIGADNHFLIQHGEGSGELRFYAAASRTENQTIGWIKSISIDKQGFARGAWTQTVETISVGPNYVISPADHGKHLRVNISLHIIISDFPLSIFPSGFYFDVSRTTVTTEALLKPLGSTVLQCGEVEVGGKVEHKAYTASSSKFPTVLSFRKVRVQRLTQTEWLVSNGLLAQI